MPSHKSSPSPSDPVTVGTWREYGLYHIWNLPKPRDITQNKLSASLTYIGFNSPAVISMSCRLHGSAAVTGRYLYPFRELPGEAALFYGQPVLLAKLQCRTSTSFRLVSLVPVYDSQQSPWAPNSLAGGKECLLWQPGKAWTAAARDTSPRALSLAPLASTARSYHHMRQTSFQNFQKPQTVLFYSLLFRKSRSQTLP